MIFISLTSYQVYSPHTAVDCAAGGLGDWLADIVTGTPATEQDIQALFSSQQEGSTSGSASEAEDGVPKRPTYMLQHHPSQLSIIGRALNLGNNAHERYPITKTKVAGHPDAGMGRVIRFAEPIALTSIIDRIGLGLGSPTAFPIAIPQGKQASEISIRSVALCAGSGGSLFGELEKNGETDVDLYFTGELSHHEALAAIEKGKCVICLFHSNTERGFLHSVMKPQLEQAVVEEVNFPPFWP
jgi:putative NIF3 family GTP cyclohydrolase 1 type 2